MQSNNYLAVDLGASSGRVIVFHDDKQDEIIRFKDYLIHNSNGYLTWNLPFIFENILKGIELALKKYKNIERMGIDSWGVDYVLFNGNAIKQPFFAYRDNRTIKSHKDVHKIVPFKELYEHTGIQFANFNTIYQLKDDLDKNRLDDVTDFLSIPEFFNYLLTNKKMKEYTMATTTGLVNLKTKEFDLELIDKLGYPKKMFPKLNKPGTFVGPFIDEIQKKVGGNIDVYLCATHDTASAYEAVDVDDDTIILSSGTWSLIGVKIKEGNNSIKSFNSNFTNEGGVNYIRYLKNIMGMWVFNQVHHQQSYTYTQINNLVNLSDYSETFDVNDPSLLAPSDMRIAINKLLKHNPPKTDGDIYRSIYYSLALSYKKAINELNENLNKKFTKLCIVGGGAKNQTLNDIIRKVCNIEVIAKPIEATAIGNIKVIKKGEKND